MRLAALTRMHAPSHATDTQIVHHNRHQQILRLLHPVAILEAKETGKSQLRQEVSLRPASKCRRGERVACQRTQRAPETTA